MSEPGFGGLSQKQDLEDLEDYVEINLAVNYSPVHIRYLNI
jgi:hypothetical protein